MGERQPEMTDSFYCIKCGTLVPSEALFCPRCGNRVTAPPPIPVAAPTPAATHSQVTWAASGSRALEYPPTQGFVYAGFWLRLVASIIDGIVVNLAVALVGALTAKTDNVALMTSLSLFGNWLYFALCESDPSWQGTVGKKVLGLIVVDDEGAPISFGRATGRYFGKFVSALLLGIGLLMAAFTDRKQGLHDIMAGALVVKDVPGTGTSVAARASSGRVGSFGPAPVPPPMLNNTPRVITVASPRVAPPMTTTPRHKPADDEIRSGADLSDCDLAGRYLSGRDLSSASLSKANLSGAKLSGANLSGANLIGADLSEADVREADLRGADLGGASLTKANLSGAKLNGAKLSGANLSGANLSGANLSGANLSRANLSGAYLSGADLSEADAWRAELTGANWSGADLRKSDLRWSDLSKSDLREADLRDGDLRGCNLSEADLRGANLSGAKLAKANLIGAKLDGAIGYEP
jgi:uncharacterized protein YjbI with pentapeptide repeats/uncharacterized RDD family membrane protein YckC